MAIAEPNNLSSIIRSLGPPPTFTWTSPSTVVIDLVPGRDEQRQRLARSLASAEAASAVEDTCWSTITPPQNTFGQAEVKDDLVARLCLRSPVDVEKALHDMKIMNAYLSLESLKSIIAASFEACDFNRAWCCAEHMLGRGGDDMPDMDIYNLLIDMYAKLGDVKKTQQGIQHMIDRKVMPNQVTLGLLCKAYAHHGEMDRIQDIMDTYEENGGELNMYFYAALISACGRVKPPDPQRATAATWQLSMRGLRVTSVKGLLVKVLGKNEAGKLIQKIESASEITRVRFGQQAPPNLQGTKRHGFGALQ